MAPPHSNEVPKLQVIQNEEQARICGRLFAKQVFQSLPWKVVGKQPQEDVVLYECTVPTTNTHYVRAVRQVRDTLSELEAVLGSSYRHQLLAGLLTDSYYNGGSIVDYRHIEHSTGEREHVNVQCASFRPYTSAPGTENHLLLEYTLYTRLQRSRQVRASDDNGVIRTKSIQSIIHLLRPVDFPIYGSHRREYQRSCLSRNDFSITYIVQETEQPNVLTLEVVVTSNSDPTHRRRLTGRHAYATQQQVMLKDALALTRVHLLVGKSSHAVKEYTKTPTRTTSTRNAGASQQPTVRRRTVTVHSGCTICRKKFNAFRWKHHCEVCDQAACNQCLSVIANPTFTRKKKRVCNKCLYGPTTNKSKENEHSNAKVPSPSPAPSVPVQQTKSPAVVAEPATPEPAVAERHSVPVQLLDPDFDSDADDDVDLSSFTRMRRAQTLEHRRNSNVEQGVAATKLHRASYAGAGAPPLPKFRAKFEQLKTPIADYELDFNWLNTFPKAPVQSNEQPRIDFLRSIGIDNDSTAFLRHDEMLEQLVQQVLEVSSQWDYSAVNVVDSQLTYCLAGASAVEHHHRMIEDVLPRQESASSYAVFYDAPFFVADLTTDERFRAHPLVVESGAISFLSFPIYSSTGHKCIGTLDLWKSATQQEASSHASSEWLCNMDFLLMEIWLRIEELGKEHMDMYPSGLLRKHRATSKTCSVDSSVDSRGSTRRDDSFELDLLDLEEIEGSRCTFNEEDERLDDLEKEVATKVNSRFSSMDLHSTIESLLYQANQTSTLLYQQSVNNAL
ncbi:TPA: hypothetical protein N0F65_007602 [Lagenidium giganteum]|uniref:FYVE-type domain-containing protein n=1 Tax=Lagenidium giganteum TaxID=4803 RepID=A0AAV2ZJ11_9STRA|nr:TPA: hypothetical protein N0F65_007602 [Lagenidium giganteum]